MSGYARRHVRARGVDGDGVRGPVGLGVVEHHLGQGEVSGQARGNGAADETARVPDHETHLLRGDVFGRDDQVALILTGGRVEDYDELAQSCGIRLTNGMIWEARRFSAADHNSGGE